MKTTRACLAATALFLTTLPSQAIVLSIQPASQAVVQGDQATADLVISGLGDGAAPSLGTYDLNLAFDPSILALSGVAFGSQLDILGLGSLAIVDDSLAGIITLFELSFDDPADLNALQAASFTLATLTFDTLAIGGSAISISVNALGDVLGDPLTADTIVNAEIMVEDSPHQVPHPSSIALFGLDLLGMLSRFARGKMNPCRAVA